jgi:hypothetical protein
MLQESRKEGSLKLSYIMHWVDCLATGLRLPFVQLGLVPVLEPEPAPAPELVELGAVVVGKVLSGKINISFHRESVWLLTASADTPGIWDICAANALGCIRKLGFCMAGCVSI